MKYKEAYNHATSIIAELQRENRRLKQLVAVAIKQKMDYHNGHVIHVRKDDTVRCLTCEEELE